MQELTHQLVHAVVERGAEQQALPVLGRRVQDAGDAGQEAEVGHVVGLVEHGDLDRVEGHELLLHEVFEPARAGDDDVDAGLEGGDLAVLGDAAEDRGGLQAVRLGERLEHGLDLGGELAGRGEHEAERAAGTAGPPASWAPRRATIGIANARVLPEPVLPRPRTSRPASVSGRVSTWIGNGVVLPSAVRTSTRGGARRACRSDGTWMSWIFRVEEWRACRWATFAGEDVSRDLSGDPSGEGAFNDARSALLRCKYLQASRRSVPGPDQAGCFQPGASRVN